MARLNFWRNSEASAADSPARAPDRPASEADPAEALRMVRLYEELGQGWFWSTDANGRIQYLSASAVRMLGDARVANPGVPFSDLFQRPDAEAGTMRTLSFLLAKQSRFERVLLRPAHSDEDRWWAVSGLPQYDGAGQFIGFRGVGVDVTDEKRTTETSSQLALSDALTGLPNRLRMAQLLEANLASIDMHKRACAVMLIDLDRFKQVNDTLGHPAGDALLKQVADRLCRIVGTEEKVFRLGGDEFKIILRDCDDRGELGRIATDLISIVSQPYSVDGSRCIIGASIGIAIAPIDGRSADDLIRNADLALYAAKGAGRGRFHFFSHELLKIAEERRILEGDLRDALARGEMALAYQPIVCAEENMVKGVESLIRWNHPTRGPVSPGVFIPIAEDANLIAPLGEWILRKACEDAARWPGNLRVAVNVSPMQFANDGFPDVVMSALAQSGLPAERLELEITEGVFLAESAETDAMFARLKRIGVRLALDDFGTGYSSLSYLEGLPFDKLKIDRSFVNGAHSNPRRKMLLGQIISMAHNLNMKVVAEGAETQDDVDMLQDLGADMIQGFYFAKPAVATEALASAFRIERSWAEHKTERIAV